MRAATVSSKTKKARLTMLSGKLNVIVLMTDGPAGLNAEAACRDTRPATSRDEPVDHASLDS
jgi:hypothetical protein